MFNVFEELFNDIGVITRNIMCSVLLILAFSAGAHAEKFTAADFLAWSEASQNSYIQTSITMAAFVGAQNPGERAKCLGDWYLDNPTTQARRNAELRTALRKFPTYHPTSVILAVIEKACGSFSFR